MYDAILMSLFNGVRVENIPPANESASVQDITALMMEYRYLPTPDLVRELQDMSANSRGTVFKCLGASFSSNIEGMSGEVSPLYRAFPNYTVVPFEARLVVWLLRHLGAEIEFDETLYGADPVTGFQNDIYKGNVDFDAEYTLPFVAENGGNSRRKVRFLSPMTLQDITDKAAAMLGNLTPFTPMELDFVRGVIGAGVINDETIRNIKFREKLPLAAMDVPADVYAALCNSVTDALRLAVHLSGNRMVKYGYTTKVVEPDLTLNTNPRFKLNRSQARKVMQILEGVLSRGNTDADTDFMRYPEYWKRFAKHVTSNKFAKATPMAVEALRRLRAGEMKSWEQRYEAAGLTDRIAMASQRGGEFARRLTALSRGVNSSKTGRKELIEAAKTALPTVNAMTLMQLHTHVNSTVNEEVRFHALPNGKLLQSERGKDTIPLPIKTELRNHLANRLKGTLPFSSVDIPDEAFGMFVPVGGRVASDGDVRTNRGDRVRLDFTDEDTIRFFLHWHHRCDVDMSAVAYSANMDRRYDCSYMSLNAPAMKHSGDILDGSRGAAEYVDIAVGEAKENGVRYVLMNANVYSGDTFDTFDCYVGLMIRDGRTGKHFEVSTVESKLSLDSATRNTSPVILDLETGEMIFVDLHSGWQQGSNVRTQKDALKNALRYFVNYNNYRTSFGDIVSFAGTDDPDAPKATMGALRDQQDEILALMADA